MTVLPYGDRGLLIELADTAAAMACAERVRRDPLAAGLADVVPGARTVLLVARPGVSLDRLRSVATTEFAAAAPDSRQIRLLNREPEQHPEIVVPVVYDGPDLAEVAELTGLSAAEVVAAHTGTPWRVAFGGFAPGFAYLAGGDPRLTVPRRDRPRPSVPAGSVGLAGDLSGVYPRASPGGWQLIGRTDLVLWDLDRDPPALLTAGATVRFEAVP